MQQPCRPRSRTTSPKRSQRTRRVYDSDCTAVLHRTPECADLSLNLVDIIAPSNSPHLHLAWCSTATPTKQTFGLKNKNKSSKVQKQVQIINQQESQKGRNKEVLAKEKEKEKLAERKRAEQAKKELEASLYSGPEIVQPKVPFGVGQSPPRLFWAGRVSGQ